MQLMGKDKGGRGGTVVVTSSTMGYKPCPSMPIYTATKHALIGFIRSFGVSSKHRILILYLYKK